MSEEILTKGKLTMAVAFDVVRIEVHCGDGYEAQTLFDELAGRLAQGQSITIGTKQPTAPDRTPP